MYQQEMILRQPCWFLRNAPSLNVLVDRIFRYNSYGPVFLELRGWGNFPLREVTFRDPTVFAAVEIHKLFLLCLILATIRWDWELGTVQVWWRMI